VYAICAVIFGVLGATSVYASVWQYTTSDAPYNTRSVGEAGCAALALAVENQIREYYRTLNYYYVSASCDGEFTELGSTRTITISYYNVGASAYSTNVFAVYTLSSVTEGGEGPAFSRRVAAYPVGEVVVFIGAMLLFAAGLRIGLAI